MCLANYSVDINYAITLLMLFTFPFCHPIQDLSQQVKKNEITQLKTLVSGIFQCKHYTGNTY